jgi:hypothetical protein
MESSNLMHGIRTACHKIVLRMGFMLREVILATFATKVRRK